MKDKNSKVKKITIEANLPVPLSEIQEWLKKGGLKCRDIAHLVDDNKEKISAEAKVVVGDFLKRENSQVKIKKITHSFIDSANVSHGMAYFRVELRGTEEELKKVAGEDKLFIYDWNK